MGETDELYGTDTDGIKNTDYCKYCYDQGEVIFNGNMEEMIEFCIPNMVKANEGMTEDEARKMMKEFIPTLKYWENKNS